MPLLDPFSLSSPDRRQPPNVGSKVRIIREAGEFLVVSVDHLRHTADLLLLGSVGHLEIGVRLANIEPATGRPSKRRSILTDGPPLAGN